MKMVLQQHLDYDVDRYNRHGIDLSKIYNIKSILLEDFPINWKAGEEMPCTRFILCF